MRGRFGRINNQEETEDYFHITNPNDDLFEPKYDIAPSQDVSVVVIEQENRILKSMRWGLIPSWADDASIGNKFLHARAETVAQKPSFKNSLKVRRCLVPAKGFYLWKKTANKKTKIPFFIYLKNKKLFAFAGLWNAWQSPESEKLFSFAIITTRANKLIMPIHNRMPAIIKREDEDKWLDPKLMDAKKLLPLLNPYPSDLMEYYQVSV